MSLSPCGHMLICIAGSPCVSLIFGETRRPTWRSTRWSSSFLFPYLVLHPNLQRVVTPLQERRQRRMLFFHTTIRELQVSVCALELEKHNYSWHSHSKGPDQNRYKIHCLDTISLQLTLGVCWSLNNLLICCLFFDSSSTFQATDSTTLYWFNKINICYSPFQL